MQRMLIRCDHCGKILDAMHDYDNIDIIICSPIPSNSADLCADCFNDLINKVEAYLHVAKDNPGEIVVSYNKNPIPEDLKKRF